MKKAQAAMEYLMTYGWAILIVIIVAAALVALGVFDPCTWSPPAATGFSVFSIPAGGWSFNSSGFELKVQNAMGAGVVNITNVDVTYGTTTSTTLSPNASNLAVGESDSFTITGGITAPSAGICYSVTVDIVYTTAAGIAGQHDTGTINGRAS